MAVVVLAVCPNLVFRSAVMQHSVTSDVVVVTDVLESPVPYVVCLAGFKAQATPWRSS